MTSTDILRLTGYDALVRSSLSSTSGRKVIVRKRTDPSTCFHLALLRLPIQLPRFGLKLEVLAIQQSDVMQPGLYS